jgi:hypothetical protein
LGGSESAFELQLAKKTFWSNLAPMFTKAETLNEAILGL